MAQPRTQNGGESWPWGLEYLVYCFGIVALKDLHAGNGCVIQFLKTVETQHGEIAVVRPHRLQHILAYGRTVEVAKGLYCVFELPFVAIEHALQI